MSKRIFHALVVMPDGPFRVKENHTHDIKPRISYPKLYRYPVHARARLLLDTLGVF